MEYVYECKVPDMTSEFCKHVIEKFEKDSSKGPGRTLNKDGTPRVNDTVKKSVDLRINHSTEHDWSMEDEYLNMILRYGFDKYLQYLDTDIYKPEEYMCSTFSVYYNRTGFQIQKYGVGDHFSWHVDDDNTLKMKLAYIMYLNTLPEDAGGETQFWNGKSIRPKEGYVLFFPATWTYPHRGAEVKSGFKYIITGFLVEKTS